MRQRTSDWRMMPAAPCKVSLARTTAARPAKRWRWCRRRIRRMRSSAAAAAARWCRSTRRRWTRSWSSNCRSRGRGREEYVRGLLEMSEYASALQKCLYSTENVRQRMSLADRTDGWMNHLLMCAPIWDMRGEDTMKRSWQGGEVFGGSAKEAARHHELSKAFMLDANGRGTEHEGLLCARPRKNRNKKKRNRRRAMTRMGTRAQACGNEKQLQLRVVGRPKGRRTAKGGTVKVNGMRRLQGETRLNEERLLLTELRRCTSSCGSCGRSPAYAESRGVPAARQDQLGARVQREAAAGRGRAAARAGGGGCDARPGARGGGAEGRRQ